MQHSSSYAYGADKKLLESAKQNTHTLDSVNVPAAAKENGTMTTSGPNNTLSLGPTSVHKGSRNMHTKMASELSSVQTPNNSMLQAHIKQTQELHNMLKTFLARAQTDK